MNTYTKELQVAKDIARKAGVTMKKYFFQADQGVQRKQDGSAVTMGDIEINRFVIEELAKHFDDGIIGEEESTTEYGMGRKWFCDPIDGTKAFVWGVPTAMFSLGLVIDGVPVCGVAYDPFLDLMYSGAVGAGSFCNDAAIKVSPGELAGNYLALPSNIRKLIKQQELVERLHGEKVHIALFSGAVYKSCLVAKGKMVGYVEWGVGTHDMAAVQVIVEQAGGMVTGIDGKSLDYSKPFQGAIVSNKIVHDKLVEIVNL